MARQMSVQTLTESINIALTDEHLADIDAGAVDVYEAVTNASSDYPEINRGVVRVAVLGEETRRYEITVREV